jgi:hypothetical protein
MILLKEYMNSQIEQYNRQKNFLQVRYNVEHNMIPIRRKKGNRFKSEINIRFMARLRDLPRTIQDQTQQFIESQTNTL